MIAITVNGKPPNSTSPRTYHCWALRDVLGMSGTKFGCGLGMCVARTVHVNGAATRWCITPLGAG